MIEPKHDDRIDAFVYSMAAINSDYARRKRNIRRWDVAMKTLIIVVSLGAILSPLWPIFLAWWRL